MATNKELKALITIAGKMDPSMQQAMLKTQSLTTKTSKQLGNLGKVGGGLLKASGVALASLVAAGGAALFKLGSIGKQTAQDLEEVQNVVEVTFGDDAAKINSWSQSLLNSFGLSELSAKKFSSTMGAMFKSSGIAGNDVLAMSQNMTMLSGDMASFHNLKPEEMFEKLRSGISGETEPLKQLGINMSAANLETFAMSQGIDKSYQSMSEAEKTMLRYNYILNATKDAQGDFSRTSDGTANQQRLLTENITQLAGKLMQDLMPAFAEGYKYLNQFISGLDTEAIASFVGQIGGLVMELMPLVMSLLPVIVKAVTTLLPPLIKIINIVLPPIVSFLDFLVGIAAAGLTKLAEIIGKVADFFGGGGSKVGTPQTQKFALGGFANQPSIFGEAGLEAAIPIKPGNPRSIGLLQKTAKLLGVGGGYQGNGEKWSLTYAPVISGVPVEQLQPILRQHSQDIEEMLDSRMNLQRRMSFGTA